MPVELKYRYFNSVNDAQEYLEEKEAAEQHPIMYQNKPGSKTKRNYVGLKQNLLWRGIHSEWYFKTRPYVIVWFERQQTC